MTVDIILTDKEMEEAIKLYLIRKNVIRPNFKLVKKYQAMNNFIYTDEEEEESEDT